MLISIIMIVISLKYIQDLDSALECGTYRICTK